MNAPVRREVHLSTSITLGDLCLLAIAIFVILAYFNNWGGH